MIQQVMIQLAMIQQIDRVDLNATLQNGVGTDQCFRNLI